MQIHISMNMSVMEDFLKNKEKNTQRNYKWIIKQYFDEIKQDPDKYFTFKKHDYKKDIAEWFDRHLDEVPKTRNTKLNIVKSLFEYQEVMLPKAFWVGQRRKKKGSRAATLDRVPSKEEFKRILNHGTIKDKALFLLLGSSGMRIDEALRLTTDMIDFNLSPVTISLPGHITKTGDPRITFISDECKEYLLEWLKIRDDYIEQAIRRTGHLNNKNRGDNTIFAFKYNIAWTRWVYLIKKAGLDKRDPTTNRYVLHIHSLRKMFLSRMKEKIPGAVAEALAGHEEGLDSAYKRYTKYQLAEYYSEGMPMVTVFVETQDLSKVNEEISKLKEDNQRLQNELNQMNQKILKKLAERELQK